MRCFCSIVILLQFVVFISVSLVAKHVQRGSSTNWSQKGAVVVECNNKYFVNCTVITRRMKRGEPYTTNYTATALYESGNNVTLKITLQAEGYGEVLVLKQKFCEIMNVEWLTNYITSYANFDVTHCPFPASTYEFRNLVFPPKGMPQHFPSFFKGKLRLQITVLATKTEELITVTRLDLYTKVK